MLLSLILVASLHSSIGGTVWWRTEGAAVIEPPSKSECSMYFFNQTQAVVLDFGKSGLQRVLASDPAWDALRPASSRPAIVQMRHAYQADYRLVAADQNGTPLIEFQFRQSSPTLRDIALTKEIVVSLDSNLPMLRYSLPRDQMHALIRAMRRCRRVVH
jgi:hypothetical protein